MLISGEPLIRTKPRDLAAAGIERAERVTGARDGSPLLADGRVVDVANVIWSTGYSPGLSWIELPIMDAGYPRQERGVVAEEPGLYFVGQKFMYAASSATLPGVGRDAAYVANHLAARWLLETVRQKQTLPPPSPRARGQQRSRNSAVVKACVVGPAGSPDDRSARRRRVTSFIRSSASPAAGRPGARAALRWSPRTP